MHIISRAAPDHPENARRRGRLRTLYTLPRSTSSRAGSMDVPASTPDGGSRDDGATPVIPEKRSPSGEEDARRRGFATVVFGDDGAFGAGRRANAAAPPGTSD